MKREGRFTAVIGSTLISFGSLFISGCNGYYGDHYYRDYPGHYSDYERHNWHGGEHHDRYIDHHGIERHNWHGGEHHNTHSGVHHDQHSPQQHYRGFDR